MQLKLDITNIIEIFYLKKCRLEKLKLENTQIDTFIFRQTPLRKNLLSAFVLMETPMRIHEYNYDIFEQDLIDLLLIALGSS